MSDYQLNSGWSITVNPAVRVILVILVCFIIISATFGGWVQGLASSVNALVDQDLEIADLIFEESEHESVQLVIEKAKMENFDRYVAISRSILLLNVILICFPVLVVLIRSTPRQKSTRQRRINYLLVFALAISMAPAIGVLLAGAIL